MNKVNVSAPIIRVSLSLKTQLTLTIFNKRKAVHEFKVVSASQSSSSVRIKTWGILISSFAGVVLSRAKDKSFVYNSQFSAESLLLALGVEILLDLFIARDEAKSGQFSFQTLLT